MQALNVILAADPLQATPRLLKTLFYYTPGKNGIPPGMDRSRRTGRPDPSKRQGGGDPPAKTGPFGANAGGEGFFKCPGRGFSVFGSNGTFGRPQKPERHIQITESIGPARQAPHHVSMPVDLPPSSPRRLGENPQGHADPPANHPDLMDVLRVGSAERQLNPATDQL